MVANGVEGGLDRAAIGKTALGPKHNVALRRGWRTARLDIPIPTGRGIVGLGAALLSNLTTVLKAIGWKSLFTHAAGT